MTDRDTFAAAALTGLLAQGDDGSFSEESYARAAYRWADAMLAVRDSRTADTTTCETAPAAKGSVPDSRTENEPVAWVAWFDDEDGPDADFLFCTKERADSWCCKRGANPAPLYRLPQPTLTDEERIAVEHCCDVIDAKAYGDSATLRRLLERTK